ncbi:MAG: T9SS type A sorting domain-containing protein [Bacteroidia bacterium]
MNFRNQIIRFSHYSSSYLVWLLLLCLPCSVTSQLLFNGGAIIHINGGNSSSGSAYLTFNNPAAVPIITGGGGVNGIMMESEFSITKYNLINGTTPITLPLISSVGESFPLTLTPTAAGTGTANANIQFSCTRPFARATGWDNVSYMPVDVTNMTNSSVNENSGRAIDRFWIIDAFNYSTSPGVDLRFSYINAEADVNGGNSINIQNLQAEAYNIAQNSWDVFPKSGVNTPGTPIGTVNNVSLAPGQMGGSGYRSWTLLDNSSPLAVTTNPTFKQGLTMYAGSGNVYFQLNSLWDEQIRLTAFDMNGKIITEQSFAVHAGINNNAISFPFASGIYLFRIQSDHYHDTRKLLIHP